MINRVVMRVTAQAQACDVTMLTHDISDGETKAILFEMEGNKAPGVD